MSEFIGRKEELKTLSKLYEKTGFQMAVIYGKRRIGKTTLLTEFIKDKKAVCYVATKGEQSGIWNCLHRKDLFLL